MEAQDKFGHYFAAVFVGMIASYGASYLIGNSVERWASKRFLPSLLEK